jgi:hypothetical protein
MSSSAKREHQNQKMILTTKISYYAKFVKIDLIELKCSKMDGSVFVVASLRFDVSDH